MHANFLKFIFLAIWLAGAGVFADNSGSVEGLAVHDEAVYAEVAARAATITPASTLTPRLNNQSTDIDHRHQLP